MKELISPEIINNSFEANGRKYNVSTTLSIDRYREYEKLEHHIVFGADITKMVEALDELDEMLNKIKFTDCAVKVRNLRDGIAYKADKSREHPILYLCALILNREGEDISVYDQAVSDSKIQEWKQAGIEMPFFFQLANSMIGFFSRALEKDLKNISEEEAQPSEPTSKSSPT